MKENTIKERSADISLDSDLLKKIGLPAQFHQFILRKIHSIRITAAKETTDGLLIGKRNFCNFLLAQIPRSFKKIIARIEELRDKCGDGFHSLMCIPYNKACEAVTSLG